MKVRAIFSVKVRGEYHIPGTPSEIFTIAEEDYDKLKYAVEVVDPPIKAKSAATKPKPATKKAAPRKPSKKKSVATKADDE